MITIYLKQYNKIIRNADTKLFDELGYDDILWIDMLLKVHNPVRQRGGRPSAKLFSRDWPSETP